MVDLPIDWRVLTFTVAVTMAAVVLFATAPTLYAIRVPSLEAVQDAGRGAGGRRTGLLSSGLVVVQVALSLVVLAAAGVFVRTLTRFANVPLGFDPEGVLVITVTASRTDAEPAARLREYERIIQAVAAVPGVTRAAGSIWTPVGTGAGGMLTDARGRRADMGRQVGYNFITPGWFATYRTAFRTGRDLEAHDDANAARVAIVNETLNRSLLHGRGAGAGTIEAGPCGGGGCAVVGVVADAVYGTSLRDPPPPTVYVPLAQSIDRGSSPGTLRVSVRASGDRARVIGALTEVLRGVKPGLTFAFRPLDILTSTDWSPRSVSRQYWRDVSERWRCCSRRWESTALRGMRLRAGERVRWYLFANPNEEESLDVHTPHWHGQTAVVNHMRMDMVMLTPMMGVVADMTPDDVGTWLFHCHMPGHFKAGMRTVFQVLAP